MFFNKICNVLNKVADRGTLWLHCAGVIFLLVMVFLTTVDVTLRYVFNKPLPGTYELMEFMMVIVVAFGLAYTANRNGHIKIEVLISRFPVHVQAIVNSITTLASLVLFIFVTISSASYALSKYQSGLESSVLHIAVYPFIALVAIGSGIFCFALLVDFINLLLKVIKSDAH